MGHKPFVRYHHGSAYQGLFAHTKPDFAFCNIEKNGCSSWLKVFDKVVHADVSVSRKTAPYGLAQKQFRAIGAEGVGRIFENGEAVRAVMVRDPLARFVSAYLNKCYADHCSSSFCFARGKGRKGEVVSFQEVVAWYKRRGFGTTDGHWSRQSAHCELATRLSEFNLVGMMTKSSLGDAATCILEAAGLSRFNARSAKPADGPYWVTHENDTADLEEEAVLRRFFTKETAEALRDELREDYETFHLPWPPGWLDGATGEWASAKSLACEKPVLAQTGSSQGLGVLPEEDDIVALARRAGYFGL